MGDSAARSLGKSSKRGKDSVTTTFEAFSTEGTVLGTDSSYGGSVSTKAQLFYSQREPVGMWWISNVANDIWDNWYRVESIKNPDANELNDNVQKVMNLLKAKTQLPRETVFERRYGTAILLLSYTGFNETWETPLFVPEMDGSFPKLDGVKKLLQITPYPWTSVSSVDVVKEQGNLRYGLPEYYNLVVGSPESDGAMSLNVGSTEKSTIKVHWTRVIHDAPRLDEHPYLGESAINVIFDDLVGARNARWGMYQGYYRNGQGFPVFHTKGTKKENQDWVTAGGVNDVMNARGYFVCGDGEDMEFRGAQAAALPPGQYFDTYFTFIAAATGVSQDSIKGVSAGRVSGSEVNERQYFKAITLQQGKKEPMLRELIDRLIQTGQVEFDGEYTIEWTDPTSVNPQDKAAIEFLQERTNALRLQTETIDEVRERKAMEPLPDGAGKEILPQPGQFGPTTQGAANQEEPFNQATKPAKPETTEKTPPAAPDERLFDKVLGE